MFKKIMLFAGLGFVALGIYVGGVYKQYEEAMAEFNKDPIKHYREGLLYEVEGSALHMAAYRGDKEKVSSLIQQGHNIHDKRNSFQFTPFHMAIFNGKVEVADLLLSKGAKIDEKTNFDQTPLQWAAFMGQENSVKFLIERGVPLEETGGHHGWTAIHSASRMGHLNIVKILVENGAKKNRKTSGGQTAEELAKSFKQKEVARYLSSD